MRKFLLVALMLAPLGAQAALYKCEANGRSAYQDHQGLIQANQAKITALREDIARPPK